MKHALQSQAESDSSESALYPVITLSLRLPDAIVYISHLRKTARCLMDSLSITQQDTEDLELILGELATNAVRHARGRIYDVHLEYYVSKLVITVTDNGMGFPTEPLPMGNPRPDEFGSDDIERIGGFGLPMVYSLSDHVEILPNIPTGTKIRAHKTLQATR